MKSGMLAADAVFEALAAGRAQDRLEDHAKSLERLASETIFTACAT